jgi:mono/diheme cytochrome c family protein
LKAENVTLCLALVLLAASGCRQGLYDQAKYQPYEANPMFYDGNASRPLPPHTVARGFLREDASFYTGLSGPGTFRADFPMQVDRPLLERGQARFDIFCSPCHGKTGAGDGMIVQRGYKRPPAYWDPRVQGMPVGYYVNVMTEGFGQMPSYAGQVPPRDRWAIAAYLRALQLSRGFPLDELTPEERAQLVEIPVPEAASQQPQPPEVSP